MRKSRHANTYSKNQFFCENFVVKPFSELRPESNERYENSTFYGPFRFLIFFLIFNEKTNFINQHSKYRQAYSRIFSMKWLIYKIIHLLNIRMNIKNLNKP